KPHPNVASQKSTVDEEWTNMSMVYVVNVGIAFRFHLEAILGTEGSHLEFRHN
ncbi:Uncharacterized protein FKW44_002669, partial [Caligus rogercresseyi]